MTLRFGTDGVRGVANEELTPELVLALGRAAARVLGAGPFVVGRDTRLSGPLLQAALAAGLASEGAGVVDVGVLPTPGVAWLSMADRVPAAVISASHNPFPDNGVKFFMPGGRKLSDVDQARFEEELDRVVHVSAGPGPTTPVVGAAVGRLTSAPSVRRYVEGLVATLDGRGLDGLRVVVDCAHGAASESAPAVLRALGADVSVMNDRPDGVNINDGCGSTHLEGLQQKVVELGAAVGLALDGDADRVLAVDAAGQVVDGDQIIALCALDRRDRGLLPDDTVVVTVMANLGFRQAMDREGITWVETGVGDRQVVEAMEAGGWALGGEQSGHIVFRDLATTGDGVLTGIQILDVMVRRRRSLAELASVMTRMPQVLRNVAVSSRAGLNGSGELAAAADLVGATLGERGRVLVRPSGTEPVVRVMVEAVTLPEAERACSHLCEAVRRIAASAPAGRG